MSPAAIIHGTKSVTGMFPPVLTVVVREGDDLPARLKSREPQALAELYDRYGRAIYLLILRIVRNTGVAEDLTQTSQRCARRWLAQTHDSTGTRHAALFDNRIEDDEQVEVDLTQIHEPSHRILQAVGPVSDPRVQDRGRRHFYPRKHARKRAALRQRLAR